MSTSLTVLSLIASSQERCAKSLVELLIRAIDGEEALLPDDGKELSPEELRSLQWHLSRKILTSHSAEQFRRATQSFSETNPNVWWILTQIRNGGDHHQWEKIEQWGTINLPRYEGR